MLTRLYIKVPGTFVGAKIIALSPLVVVSV